jgi:hypothetical protein
LHFSEFILEGMVGEMQSIKSNNRRNIVKKILSSYVVAFLLLSSFTMVFFTQTAKAEGEPTNTIFIAPNLENVTIGDVFGQNIYCDVDWAIDNVSIMSVSFDSSVINYESTSQGDLFTDTQVWMTPENDGTIDNSSGFAQPIVWVNSSSVNNTVDVVANITFSAVGVGISTIQANGVTYNNSGYNSTTQNSTATIRVCPQGPSSFEAETLTDSSINLTFSSGLGADKIIIYYKNNSAPSYFTDGTFFYNGTGPFVTHNGLDPNTNVYYRAYGWNATQDIYSLESSSMIVQNTTYDDFDGQPEQNTTIHGYVEEEEEETANDQVNDLFDIELEQNFTANDTDGDGEIELDEFNDPNGVLSAERLVNMSGHNTYLVKLNNSYDDMFVWNTTDNSVNQVTHDSGTVTEEKVDTDEEKYTITVQVEKSDWIYIEINDAHPEISNLTVKRSDGTIISPDMIWRENDKIYVLDDPDTNYTFEWGYEILPPIFSISDGNIFDTAQPEFSITYLENVTIIESTLNTEPIELTTNDDKEFIFSTDSNLSDGEYTLSITVNDSNDYTRTDTITFSITVAGEIDTNTSKKL